MIEEQNMKKTLETIKFGPIGQKKTKKENSSFLIFGPFPHNKKDKNQTVRQQ